MLTKKHPHLLKSDFKNSKPPSTILERRRDISTRVVVKFDVGFGNGLYIRGSGAGLSWEKGILLRNHKADEWVWEPSFPFATCEFKILINDKIFEAGENHPLTFGSSIQYRPKFS